jgi:octanoyl-[GcvH]:protein N-octanoyltransferase
MDLGDEEGTPVTLVLPWPARLEIEWIDDVEHPQANMDLDPQLGTDVASGRRPPLIRLWRAAKHRGIGVSRKDVATEAGQRAMQSLIQDGYSVVVRQTGGTAVPQGEGVLHVSYLFPRLPYTVTTDDYYRMLCGPIIEWLGTHGCRATTGELPGSYCDGKYNVLVNEQKLVGTAQAWRGGLAGMKSARPGYILAHACIVVDVDMEWATGLINRFYEEAGNPYRVDASTSTTLRECLPGLFQGASASEATHIALRDLQQFYRAYLSHVCD